MTHSQSTVARAQTEDQCQRSWLKQTGRRLIPCLVFSANPERRSTFTTAMAQAGWAPVSCRNVEEIATQGARIRAPLAVIDMVGAPAEARDQCQALCGRLLQAQETLLTICGHDADPTEEIWARQLGVWLYLPGMGDSEGILQFASEARLVVEKIFPMFSPPAEPKDASTEDASTEDASTEDASTEDAST